jgi:hypothetical protein
MNPGEIVINAIIRAGAITDVVRIPSGERIFIWSANASEQIEAAINEAGYTIVKSS